MEQEAWRILIVEDDRRLAELTREYLEGNGLKVDIEANGALAAARILAERPDLVVLDLMLPGEDGLSICRQVRPQFDGPILMLTARTDDMDEVLGLEMGADDYVCKPVRPRVLLARIRALLRRSEAPEAGAPAADSKRLAFGRLVIDNAMREAWLDGTTIGFDQRRVRPALAAGGERRAHSLPRGDLQRPARHRVRRPGPLHRRAHLADPPEDRRRPDAPAADQDRTQQGLPVRRRGLRRFFLRAGARASRSARINSSGQRPGARR